MEANYQGLSTVTSIQPPVVNLHWRCTCKNVMSMKRTDVWTEHPPCLNEQMDGGCSLFLNYMHLNDNTRE